MKQTLLALAYTLIPASALGWGFVKFGLPWLTDKLIGLAMASLMAALRAEEVEDTDLKAFQHDLTLAFIRLAEAKLPGSGLGPEKKVWVIGQALRLFPWLKGHEEELGKAIDDAIAKAKAGLNALEEPPKAG